MIVPFRYQIISIVYADVISCHIKLPSLFKVGRYLSLFVNHISIKFIKIMQDLKLFQECIRDPDIDELCFVSCVLPLKFKKKNCLFRYSKGLNPVSQRKECCLHTNRKHCFYNVKIIIRVISIIRTLSLMNDPKT